MRAARSHRWHHNKFDTASRIGGSACRALNALRRTSSRFDVLYLFLPERWSAGFRGPLGEDFDLHVSPRLSVPPPQFHFQILREDRVLKYKCRAASWRLGLATYCRLVEFRGGSLGRPGTAYIGLGYAIRASDTAAAVRQLLQSGL
ncbi:MAG: hypothetical protein R3C20_15725 [Planctomycetaceae bacterium]